MIQLGPRHFLAERVEDLPAPRPGIIFKDCETRRRGDDVTQGGLNPYLGDRAAMWAIAFDDDGPAISVPIRMRSSPNLSLESVLRWQGDIVRQADRWVNHNVKFDAHFAAVDGVSFPETCQLVDTLTLSKLIDSDRMSHGLKELIREVLSRDTGSEERVQAWLDGVKLPRRKKARDYALVPSDILGYYACDDVLGNRDLYRHLLRVLPEQVVPTWQMEQQLTPVLWDMENVGLRTDKTELEFAKLKSLRKQILLATRVNELTGTEFADSASYSYALLVGKWGLPVLSRDKKSGNPSFNYDALLQYLAHPDVTSDPTKTETIKLILALRDEETFSSLFLDVFLEQRDENGYVHPMYNQLVRTGRMSCSEPNAQQFDKRAKGFVLTDGPGDAFMDSDASQIEFRVIVHYIKDEAAIKAYNENPRTDFHQWVAELCKIKRKPAKNINFAQAFGAGKGKIVAMLAADEDVITAVNAQLNEEIAAGALSEAKRLERYRQLSWDQGLEVYKTYHERLRTLKPTAQHAQNVARSRGFIFNIFGRRRHLPTRAAHVAFNTLCQGTAMDIIKRRMIATAPRYNPEMKKDGITLRANVHDAVLHHGPAEAVAKWSPWIMSQLEAPEPLLRVPVRWETEIKQDRWEALAG